MKEIASAVVDLNFKIFLREFAQNPGALFPEKDLANAAQALSYALSVALEWNKIT